MGELTKENVLEFWNNATVEEQRKYFEKVFSLINSVTVKQMWSATKDEIKRENPDLIIRIIKEKLSNGQIYPRGLWLNTPGEVQKQKFEEIFELYGIRRRISIERIWSETDNNVKELKKEVFAKSLAYDVELLEKYGILECLPVVPGMIGVKGIHDMIDELVIAEQSEVIEATKMMSKIPNELFPYFFGKIADIMPEYVILFWESIDESIQEMVGFDVIRKIPSEDVKKSIWNKFTPEKQKNKIMDLLNKDHFEKAEVLIPLTNVEINKEILEELIKSKDPKRIVLEIWCDLQDEVQNEYFESIMEIYAADESAGKRIWGNSAESVQRRKFQQMLNSMSGDIDRTIIMIQATKLPISETLSYILQIYQGQELEKIVENLREVDVESYEILKGKISPDVSRTITIKNASELSIERLEELSKFFNISKIQMSSSVDNLKGWQTKAYDVETYKKCRSAIDELLDGIDMYGNTDEPDREKRIFGEVIKRLANHISYDYEISKKLDDNTATPEECFMCASMSGGLINKKCVCSGYAEIVRNVFACCGIEVRYISGNNIDSKKNGHAWNQIKLDGVWYNMDLTWDRDRIVAGEMPQYLLKCDLAFVNHDKYDTKNCKTELCYKTVSYEDMKWYLYQQLEMPKPVHRAVRRSRRRRVESAFERIATSQALVAEGPEKREEQWMQ